MIRNNIFVRTTYTNQPILTPALSSEYILVFISLCLWQMLRNQTQIGFINWKLVVSSLKFSKVAAQRSVPIEKIQEKNAIESDACAS